MNKLTREDFTRLDQIDPLAEVRDEFTLPHDLIYFDGNSLGPLPKRTINTLETMIHNEWGDGLISSWNVWNEYTRPYCH